MKCNGKGVFREISNEIYTSTAQGLLSSVGKLWQKARNIEEETTRQDVKGFLLTKRSYQASHPRRYRYTHQKIRLSGINSVHASDLPMWWAIRDN